MRIFETKIEETIAGKWKHYFLFGRKIKTKLLCLYRYR